MNERQRYPVPLNLTPRAMGLVRDTGHKIKEAALRLLPGFSRTPPIVQRANRAAAKDVDGFPSFTGSNGGWARTEYGEYYATSVPVYAAIRLRADALGRAPAIVYRTAPDGTRVKVGRDHPAQMILERVNRWFTRQ